MFPFQFPVRLRMSQKPIPTTADVPIHHFIQYFRVLRSSKKKSKSSYRPANTSNMIRTNLIIDSIMTYQECLLTTCFTKLFRVGKILQNYAKTSMTFWIASASLSTSSRVL